jgi:transposase, IS5 family
MYRKSNQSSISPEKFELPVSIKLSSKNRWVIMAELIPWSDFESEYAQNFSKDQGAPAKSFRMALGALIIKEKLGTSDKETVEQIKDNPYLQYFVGMSDYSNEAPFEASMLVHFRERIDKNLINKINSYMVKNLREKEEKKKEKEEVKSIKNQGKLILDATCAPADISYPNDLGILNKARRQTEKIIDSLYIRISGLPYC